MAMYSNSSNKVSYEDLVPGYEFPSVSYELSAPVIAKYLDAVDSSDGDFAPPLGIAAYAIVAMTGSLSLPPGTIHASQEFEFFKPVPIGAIVNYKARVARKLTRSKLCILVMEIDVFNQDKERVQSGKATIVLPA